MVNIEDDIKKDLFVCLDYFVFLFRLENCQYQINMHIIRHDNLIQDHNNAFSGLTVYLRTNTVTLILSAVTYYCGGHSKTNKQLKLILF